MSASRLFTLAIAALFCAPVFAADPPTAEAASASTAERPPLDSAAALELGRELRKRSDAGDAAATYNFWSLLVAAQTGEINLEPQHFAELRKLSGYGTLSSWLFKAAEGGHPPAIDAICRLAEDKLAPAYLRDEGVAKCAALRAKYPAK